MTPPSLASSPKISRTALLLAGILPAAGLILIAWLTFWFTSNHAPEAKQPAPAPASAKTPPPRDASPAREVTGLK